MAYKSASATDRPNISDWVTFCRIVFGCIKVNFDVCKV